MCVFVAEASGALGSRFVIHGYDGEGRTTWRCF
jgi:hypothetical protein